MLLLEMINLFKYKISSWISINNSFRRGSPARLGPGLLSLFFMTLLVFNLFWLFIWRILLIIPIVWWFNLRVTVNCIIYLQLKWLVRMMKILILTLFKVSFFLDHQLLFTHVMCTYASTTLLRFTFARTLFFNLAQFNYWWSLSLLALFRVR